MPRNKRAKSFRELTYDCGLSLVGAARLLGVSYNTAKKWHTDKRTPPKKVMEDLRRYRNSAIYIFNL